MLIPSARRSSLAPCNKVQDRAQHRDEQDYQHPEYFVVRGTGFIYQQEVQQGAQEDDRSDRYENKEPLREFRQK